MMHIYERLHNIKKFFQIVFARARAHIYSMLGANMAPKCLFGENVRLEYPWKVWIGTRCMLQENVWLNIGSKSACLYLGEYTFIGRNTEIEVSRKVTIGKGCLIAPNVFITDHNHSTKMGKMMFEQSCNASVVSIGDDVWIGANAVILPGVTIATGAVVAAGAVVNRDVGEYMIVGGVPAKALASRYSTLEGSN